MGRRTLEFILGLTGSIMGIVLGCIVLALTLVLGAASSLFSLLLLRDPELDGIAPFFMAGTAFLFFSVVGAIGAFLVKASARVGGSVMFIAAVSGTIFTPFFLLPTGLLLGISGLIGILRKDARPSGGGRRRHRWIELKDPPTSGPRGTHVFGPEKR